MEEVKKVFEKYQIPIKFYRVHKDKDNGLRGCFTSHIKIIKRAHKKNLDHVLIFEDDIVSQLNKTEFDDKMKRVYDFIGKHDYDIFFIGSVPNIIKKTTTRISKDIFRVHAFCSHAYILSKAGINKYKDMVYSGTPIDFVYVESERAYAIYPSIFYQNESKSDISRFSCYGFKTIGIKLMEYYASHINVPLFWPIAIIIVFSVVMFFITGRLIFAILPTLLLVVQIMKL